MVQNRMSPGKTGRSCLGIVLVVLGGAGLALCLSSDILLYGVIAAVPLVGGGLWLLIRGEREHARIWQSFVTGYTATAAKILDRGYRTIGHSGSEDYIPWVIIQFDAGGKQVTLSADVSQKIYVRAGQDRTLIVRYANADPRIALLDIEWPTVGMVYDRRIGPTGRNIPLALGVGLVAVGIAVGCVATAWYWGFPWYIIACIPIAGVFFMIIGGRTGDSMRWFENASRTTQAGVLEREWKEDRCFFTIQFDADGRPVKLKARVGQEVYDATEKGETLTIRYSNADPRTALLEGEW